jgi:hypothetical protein
MGINYNPRTVTDGLVLALDAANSKSYPGSGTTWTDLSGRGNTGTLTNGPTYSGANGGSIVFDGVDDYVSIPHNTNQSFVGDFSIESIIYATNATANCIIQKGTGNDNFQEYWLLQDMRGSNRAIFIIGNSNNTSSTNISTATIFAFNTYYHIVSTVQGSTGTIYVNGVPQASGSISSRHQSTGDIRIGRRVDDFAQAQGKIPMVKLYNRALSAQEIQQNFNATRGRYGI